MKVCIVGGIFDASNGYKAKHAITPETTLARGLSDRGIQVHTIGHRDFSPGQPFDIVHIHHLGKAALRMASEMPAAKFVFTSHDGPLINGYETSWMRKTAYQYVLQRADALVALSEKERSHLADRVNNKIMRVIPNGIPNSVFELGSTIVTPRADTLELLYVGQLIPLKGVDILLRAFAKIRQQHKARLSLVYHNAMLERSFQEQAKALQIADSVQFAGSVASADLATWYQKSDIVVLPSHAEALPSVITEALLCGKPIVATDVGGIAEQVGRFGCVVPPNNEGRLGDAIAQVIEDLSTYRSIALQMRDHAQVFSVARNDPATLVAI